MSYYGYINDLMVWIDANLDKNISIDDVVIKSGYSRRYLQKMFFNHTGITLGRYMRVKRLSLAAKEIIDSNLSIIEISIIFGYESHQSFTRTFKQHYSIPPAKYRNKLRKNKE